MAHEAVKPQRETTVEEWQRIRELLANALELEPGERSAYLDGACSSDHELRARIAELIAAHDATGAAGLELPAFALTSSEPRAADALSSQIGRRIGAYRIEAEIAQGGMGAVFRAVRADDEYQKQVAIKLVPGARFSTHAAELFRRERQVLAALEHPNIARLLDGGTTEDGIPFLVMEYVEGRPVTEYCELNRLSIDERLRLFQKLCSAVQYAHQNLVIHRDIKPANILVTEAGEPKLLDFGIAKIIAIDEPGATLTLGALTPAYASPEQIAGTVITTATDTYALGLVLYELLAGKRAFAVDTSPIALQRAVLERDPDAPSRAILANASASASFEENKSRQKLSRQLRGDLDSIVSKALRKDALERYSSAAQLQEDIARYLERQPVLAHQPTRLYQAKKFCVRHRAGVLMASLVVLLTAVGITLIARAERKARAQQAIAEKRFSDVRRLANSLLFEVHDSIRTLPGATTARELVAQRAQEYLDSLAADAGSDVSLLRELATAYGRLGSVLGNPYDANLGNSEQALRDYERAAKLRESVVAASPANPEYRRELAESYMDMATVLAKRGQDTGPSFNDKAVSILEPLAASNPANPKIQYALGKAYERHAMDFGRANKWAEAAAEHEKSLSVYLRLSEADPAQPLYQTEVAFAHKHIAGALSEKKQWQAALEHERAALAIDEAQLKNDPHNINTRYAITFTYSDTGYMLGKLGDIDAALGYYQKALAIRQELAAADSHDTRARGGVASTYNYLARLLWEKGDLVQALDDEKQALSLRESLAENDPGNETKRLQVAFAQGSIGETYVKMAFQQEISQTRRSSLCREAESWLQKALPEVEKRKKLLSGLDTEYPAALQNAITRCQSAF